MKKFDWFTILGAIAIIENTICFIIQGGWLAVLGVIFGGIWVWVAYWDWKRYQTIKNDHEEVILSFLDSDEMQSEDNSSPSDIFVGDLGCKWNARSPYLRCAIKPSGPCDKCQFYAEEI